MPRPASHQLNDGGALGLAILPAWPQPDAHLIAVRALDKREARHAGYRWPSQGGDRRGSWVAALGGGLLAKEGTRSEPTGHEGWKPSPPVRLIP